MLTRGRVVSRSLATLRSEGGMSITEVMVVLSLLAVVIVPSLQFLASTQRSEHIVSDSTQQQTDARIAMESFSRALREGAYPQGTSYVNSSIFDAANDNSVTFYSDIDGNGVAEQVTYTLNVGAAEVDRTVITPDCSLSPCDYLNGTVKESGPYVTNVRNGNMSVCGQGQSGAVALFKYFKADKGTGVLTQIPAGSDISNLVDISFVTMTIVVDVTPNMAPTCQQLATSVDLRNWRG